LLKANFKDSFMAIKSGTGFMTVEVKRGQLIFGRFKAEEELNIDGSTIYKHLQKFEESGQISIESNNKFSIITICKFDSYQNNDIEEEQLRDSNVTTTEQLRDSNVTHLKKNKNVQNDKKRAAFSKPTLEELKNHFKEIGLVEENIAQKFIAHYDSKGWKVGQQSMKDWKAACQTWLFRWKEKQKEIKSSENGPIFTRIHKDNG